MMAMTTTTYSGIQDGDGDGVTRGCRGKMEMAGQDALQDVVAQLRQQPDEASKDLLQHFRSHIDTSDIENLAHLCNELLNDYAALCIFVNTASPIAVIRPIGAALDKTEFNGSTEEPVSIGHVWLFAQAVTYIGLREHDLCELLPFDEYYTLPGTIQRLHHAIALCRFSDHYRSLIDNWLLALFGSEGISDDLIKSSAPLHIIQISPTLFKQVITVHLQGRIDIEATRSGLTYFLQDLLVYALPAALEWLLNTINDATWTEKGLNVPGLGCVDPPRVAAALRKRAVCIDVLCTFLGAESCPVVVRHIMATRVTSTLGSCKKDALSAEALALMNAMQQLRDERSSRQASPSMIKGENVGMHL